MSTRQRIDRLLVERGLFESRAKAQAAIAAGRVTANGIAVTKPSDEVAADAALRPSRRTLGSRAAASSSRPRSIISASIRQDRVCLDVGASTGGFTEVLLARGARRVYAVDVGHGQLHASLRARPRSCRWKRPTSAPSPLPCCRSRPSFVAIDVSFISLKLVLPAALALVQPPAQLVALIKPQFEAGRAGAQEGHRARSAGSRRSLRRHRGLA